MASRKGTAARTCPACSKGNLSPQESREEVLGIDLGAYPSLVCDTCGESYLDGEAMAQLEARAKDLGIWGSAESRFMRLSARFQAEALRRGISKRELLRALKEIRRDSS